MDTYEFARQIRILALKSVYSAGCGHITSALSCADIIAVLYNEKMDYDPSFPDYPDRDRLVLSKGHACPALYAALALKGFFDVAEVEFAIMETNGQLSIMPRADKRPINPGDLNLVVENEKPAVSLILDGKIHHKHLLEQKKDLVWLMKKLRQYNIEKPEDVFFFSIDGSGNIFCQLKSKSPEEGTPPPIREDNKSAPIGSGKGTEPAQKNKKDI